MSYRKKHIKTKIYKLKKSKTAIFKRPVFWVSFLFLIIVSFIIYIFVFSSNFQVRDIMISGNEKIQNEEIKNFISAHISQKIINIKGWGIESKSIFLINNKKLNKEILNNFPVLESVKISKKLPQLLVVETAKRKPIGAFCDSLSGPEAGQSFAREECFLIDKNGVIFELLSEIPDETIVIRKPFEIEQAFTGKKVIAENIISIISKIEKGLKDNLQISIEEAIVSSPLKLDIKTSEKWKIYFNLESDIDMQVVRMNLLLSSEISADVRKNLEYIDLRFKDGAYYK